jgi:hypothetical protein
MLLIPITWLVTMVTKVVKEIWARRKSPSNVPTCASTTSGMIILRVSSCSLPSRGDCQVVADDTERRLGAWTAHYKHSEGGTDSKCEQFLKREVPLAFIDRIDKRNEKPESLKLFISIEGILASKKSADDEKRSLGK